VLVTVGVSLADAFSYDVDVTDPNFDKLDAV
jgi:hypothetical protein